MSLISIDVKGLGIDPAKDAQIQADVAATIKDVRWIASAVKVIIQQAAAKFHFDLPPES